MLSRVLKEHNLKQAITKEKHEERKKTAVTAVHEFSGKLVDALNSDVEKAYNNQRALETEAKHLQQHVIQFSKQTQQWTSMLVKFNQLLKELGDVENWARTIEMDITTIACALEYAYKGTHQHEQKNKAQCEKRAKIFGAPYPERIKNDKCEKRASIAERREHEEIKMKKRKTLMKMTYFERCSYLNFNPVLLARHFRYRGKSFFKVILINGPLGNVNYYAIRVKFQFPVRPHIHSFL
ncbi:biogenesis of lysosome-related organelles complex 1 subunit 1-like isoform X2 [Hydractinia symbiolongicarpus]|uniref:biogenesis of lysosome-related organelles complex 1 subunit 1-like isoform X2 n=1 Tax=Hydractinia symbiolongicarpus TaxID=13093 RepID=UPI00255000CC|nr:biogenesis of lysosome-related organelles complex 1 subunit 1-like isoform X2 [Hydractinia symbiolongicarpus]